MDELKPCPFCGGTDILVHERTCDRNTPYNPNDRAAPTVRCGGCFASVFGQDWTGPDTAITAWNTRPREQNGEVEEKAVTTLLGWQPLTGLNKGDRLYQILEAAGLPFDQQPEKLKAALAAALGESNG